MSTERHWVIAESELLAALRRAQNEDPDLVLVELLANSETETVEGDGHDSH